MKFQIGPMPEDEGFEPDGDSGWRRLKEPGPIGAQLRAFPLAVVLVLLIFALLSGYFRSDLLDLVDPYILFLPLLMLAVFVFHEGIHAFFHPGRGTTDRSVLGFWPATLLLYAHYVGPLSRNRFLLILASPFVFLTLVPILVALTLDAAPAWLFWVTILNAAGSSVDLVGIILLLTQLPGSAIVRNKGWASYWRTEPGDAGSRVAALVEGTLKTAFLALLVQVPAAGAVDGITRSLIYPIELESGGSMYVCGVPFPDLTWLSLPFYGVVFVLAGWYTGSRRWSLGARWICMATGGVLLRSSFWNVLAITNVLRENAYHDEIAEQAFLSLAFIGIVLVGSFLGGALGDLWRSRRGRA